MPQQLIYTSAPRGIVAGRSGHCTVARSASMREALMLQLERFCYYQHLSLSGGKERPIFSCRIVDIRGTRFHVLSRIQDAGLDFTGRTNFIAHHLVFTPEEIRQFPTPPIILRDWPGWVKSWTKEPESLENENWADLGALTSKTNVPAQTWQQVTGDAVNGYGLLETRVGASFRVDDLNDEVILALVAESLELLEIRDVRRDFRSVAWNYTFTTSMQEQDNPADFRWRCIHSDNPAANRLATPDCRDLSAMRATKWTGEETAFARTGRQAPGFVSEPIDIRITEGQAVRFSAKADGVPAPTYQWYKCDKDGKETELLNGETSPDLSLSDPPFGVTRYRVWATNSLQSAQSRLAILSVEKKIRLALTKSNDGPQTTVKVVPYQKTEDDAERQRNRLAADEAEAIYASRQKKRILFISLVVGMFVMAGIIFCLTPIIKNAMTKVTAQMNGPITTDSAPPLQPANASTADSANPPALIRPSTNQAKADSQMPPPQPNNPIPTEFGLPDGWKELPIGNVLNSHADYITNKLMHARFELSGIANGFFTNRDDVFFVCRTNFETDFKATLLKIDLDSALRRSGIMIRESSNPDSRFLFLGTSPENVVVNARNDNVGFSENGDKVNSNQIVFLQFMHQKDNHVVPAYSFDDKTWKQFERYSFLASTQMIVGFAVCSGNSSNRVKVRFLDVSKNMTR